MREAGDYPPEVRRKVDYEERRKWLMRKLRGMCVTSVIDEVTTDVDGKVADLREHRSAASMLMTIIRWPGLEDITLGELGEALDRHARKVKS